MQIIKSLSLLWAAMALCCSTGHAQSNIYSQTFSGGPVTLDGTAPTGANTYAGGNSAALWSYTGTNYNFVTADGLMDGNAGSSLLSFTPQAGYIYTITASVTLPADMHGNWIAMGFTQLDPTNQDAGHSRFVDNTVQGAPWMLVRTGGESRGTKYTMDQFFSLSGASGGTTIDSENLADAAGTYTLTLVLNTSGAQWTTTASIDGTQMGSVFTYSSNPAIVAAGFGDSALGSYANGIQWNSWSLSATPVPEPPLLTSLPTAYSNVVVYAGTSPRFSVSASVGPPFGYQWFSNNAALTGATSSSYQLTNLPVGNWGNLYCVVTNIYASATSTVWTVQAVAAPTAPYPQQVLAAQPIAYWRLNEPDSGVVGNAGVLALDYAGGNNGIYTNVNLGLTGYNPVTDPTTTSAEFGETGLSFYDSYAGEIQGIDFAAPSGSNADFTVEAWANAYASGQLTAGAVVTKGEYGNNDTFNLGFDSTSAHHYRFYVRTANGSVYSANSSFVPDGQWHHLAGVCDESDGQLLLYIDGQLAAATSIPVGAGHYEAANVPVVIGAATDNATNVYDRQFYGYVNDVALYDYALSAEQILEQYAAAGVSPILLQSPPATATVYEGGVLTLPALALGTPPLTNTWFDTFNFSNVAQTVVTGTNIIDGTLVVSNVSVDWDFDTLQLTVANAYGSTNVNVTLTVNSGAPVFVKDLPPAATAVQGHAYTYSVTALGSLPIGYQWRFNGADVAGQSATNYTFDPVAGNYSVVASNAYGTATSTISALTVMAAPTDAYSSEILTTLGAVGYWPLQDTGAPAPSTIEINLGTLGPLGNAYYAPANNTNVAFGQGGALTGSGDTDTAVGIDGSLVDSYALVPRVSPELTIRPPLSLECWVNSSSTSFGDILGEGGNGLNSGNNSGNAGGFRLSWGGRATNANLQFYIYTGNGTDRSAMGTPFIMTQGAWHYCAATFDGTTARLYVDGVVLATNIFTNSMALDTWSPITLGGGMWYGGAVQRHYTGLLDEVAFYTNLLTDNEISNHYLAAITSGSNYSQTVLNDKPLLYYRMDALGYTNPPATLGAPAVNFGSSLVQARYLSGAVPGGFRGPQNSTFGTNTVAMRDNGLNGYVDAGYDPVFDPRSNQPVTAMIWAKGYPSDNRFQNPIGRGDTSWRLGWDGRDGTAHWNAGAGGEITSTQIVNDGNWHFLAGVYDGSSNYLYIDGVLDSESAATGPIAGNSRDLYIGGAPDYRSPSNQRFFGGAVAKAALFTNALSAAEIKQLYDLAGLTPGQTPVINVSGNQIIYTGTLLSSTNVAGPYSPVPGASSPYIVSHSGTQMFYRARNP